MENSTIAKLLIGLCLSFTACGEPVEDSNEPLDEQAQAVTTPTASFAKIFSTGAVLQRDQALAIWGTANVSTALTVELMLGSVAVSSAQALPAAGKWSAHLPAVHAPGAYTLRVRAGSSVLAQVTNVAVGEVWLCSGQSNMQMPVRSTDPKFSLSDVAQAGVAEDDSLRLFNVAMTSAPSPLADFPAAQELGWHSDVAHINKFSAACYSFGRELRQKLGVPVGLVQSAYGGTWIEEWIPSGVIAVAQPILTMINQRKGFYGYGDLFNSMISPLLHYPIRGMAWYQGENDAADYNASQYVNYLPDLIRNYRTLWGQGNFPALIVQLHSYGCADTEVRTPGLREDQRIATAEIQPAALITTIDLGVLERDSKGVVIGACGSGGDADGMLHPPRKAPVGHRLALAAEGLAYGASGVYVGPAFSSLSTQSGKAMVKFTNIGTGLKLQGPGTIDGFEICCDAKKSFVPASATILNTDTIEAWSSAVSAPTEVRYGFRNYLASEETEAEIARWGLWRANLYNSVGLPMTPFVGK